MKTLNLYFAIILINLFTLRATAQSKKYKFKAIQISTNVFCGNFPASNYSLVLLKDGVKLDSVFNEEAETIDAIFQLNQIYTIQIKKAGFEDAIIMINTNIPDGLTLLSRKSQKINISMRELIFNKEHKEEIVDVFVIDKTLGTLVHTSSKFGTQNGEITSGTGNMPQNSN